ncbi:sulfotransferase domain-containing protein [Halomonas sp. ISL-56]|uniref:sulfotransferase domain-containing protein n=1 Tax=Halomonas sp. ISL-56 TaxID=2819149 RepID=UPI001BEA3A70|nr:sulfotransferase domain-containing protein [Halomonas sp. ISL-56]MBT2801110.1 sulfotransferase domain-containing protein [Halomonas sp. ISL-56]
MNDEHMLAKYIGNPEVFWPLSHQRNALKIKRALDKCGYGSDKDYVWKIKDFVKFRSDFYARHLYIVNTGSAGSHWIEAMLGLLPGFYNGGEIYFPKEIKKYLSGLSSKEANEFLDAIYVIHSGGIHKDSLTATISNSANLANHRQISDFSLNKKVVLLLRDPVDVVISRTFRKNEYKKDIAPSLDDNEYLERNCKYVENFYNQLDLSSFDAVIRYEDFLENTLESLKALANLIGIDASEAEFERAVRKTSQNEEKNMLETKGETLTNIYMGEKNDHDWAKVFVRKKLNDILVKYEYF